MDILHTNLADQYDPTSSLYMVPGTEEQSESATSASNRWMRLTASVDPMSSIYMVPGTEEESEPDIWHPTDGCDSQHQLQSRWSACQLVYMIAVEIMCGALIDIAPTPSDDNARSQKLENPLQSPVTPMKQDATLATNPGDWIQCDMCDAWHHKTITKLAARLRPRQSLALQ